MLPLRTHLFAGILLLRYFRGQIETKICRPTKEGHTMKGYLYSGACLFLFALLSLRCGSEESTTGDLTDASVDAANPFHQFEAVCAGFQAPCTDGKDCCSNICDATNHTCAAGVAKCAPGGTACADPTGCCSLSCVAGKCADTICTSDNQACTS